MTLHITTPLYENADLNKRLGKRIFLKMECYQPVGSFKIRGIGALCEQAVASGKKHLISASGGNAGYAAAYAGKQLGVKVTVVVLETTSETAKQRIMAQGAEVIVKGAWPEADAYARELVEVTGGTYIHPFDNPAVWTGHATMIDEVVQQCPFKPDALAVCVGGGGLLSGLIEGLHRNHWEDVTVFALETQGADSFAQAVAAKELIRLDKINSIATSLGATQVTSKAFEWSKQHEIIPIVVTDREAVSACLRFVDDLRVLVEPACGATLSLLYDNSHYLDNYESALMIVCGGVGVTIGQLQAWYETI